MASIALTRLPCPRTSNTLITFIHMALHIFHGVVSDIFGVSRVTGEVPAVAYGKEIDVEMVERELNINL